MARTHPPYPPEFRLEEVRLVKEDGRKIADARKGIRHDHHFLIWSSVLLQQAPPINFGWPIFTQYPTGVGWLYLAVIIDMFSCAVAGWSMGSRAMSDLVVNALNMAVWNRRPGSGLIHHSDHGLQYTSLVFSKRLEEAGILDSMGTVGDALDNAVAESFYATLQAELLDRNAWPTLQCLRSAIFEFIEGFYNRRRRHSSLEYLAPMEFAERWFNQTKLRNTA